MFISYKIFALLCSPNLVRSSVPRLLKSNLVNVAKSGMISEQTSSFDLVTLADNTGLLKTFSKSDQLIIKNVFIKSIHNTFYFSIGLSAIALLLSCFMSDIRFPTNKDTESDDDSHNRQ
ncbi:unnamed protein product [Ambrosiozyma monospora]|uniref:Unnamed protein product n=1 Tax=Ambrosiozyma monospora TaxID=43982 RepID=A0ACB5T4I7_AMBMO|nr:unnamed protein product [Ambrosiozyma monospora]